MVIYRKIWPLCILNTLNCTFFFVPPLMSSSALPTNIFILQVLISTTYTKLCTTFQQLFSIVDMPFILFKNIVHNGPQGTRSFHPSQSTFIEELNDQCTKAHLETLAKCNIQVIIRTFTTPP